MVVCPRCGARQPDETAFCEMCGVPLTPTSETTSPPPHTVEEEHPPTLMAGRCSACGAVVSPEALFCEQCGAPLKGRPPARRAGQPPAGEPVICPSCGAESEPGSRFCDRCGTPLAPSTPPPAAPPETVTGRLVVQASGATLFLPPGKSEILIGRKDPVAGIFPDVDLTDHGGDRGGVSREHARILIQERAVVIEDLNSLNHTYINELRLTPGRPHPLNDGDEIRLGRVQLNYHAH